MKEVVHTPGPWVTFNYGGDVGEGDFEGLGICQQGKSMAVLMGDQNGYVCDCTDSKYQIGNASIIAACPTMYEYIQARAVAGDAAAITIMNSISKTEETLT